MLRKFKYEFLRHFLLPCKNFLYSLIYQLSNVY
ncbi:MAG: hypothetical protein J0I09_02765 [Sphingobacteriia bacterium]|nr:hypothetical protein [Sphingobacteriia bacterium]